MNFIIKAALMHFSLANSVLLLQMLAAVAIVLPLRSAGVLQFPALSARKARQLAPVTILYTANVCFTLLGLKNFNIPMCVFSHTFLSLILVSVSLQRISMALLCANLATLNGIKLELLDMSDMQVQCFEAAHPCDGACREGERVCQQQSEPASLHADSLQCRLPW